MILTKPVYEELKKQNYDLSGYNIDDDIPLDKLNIMEFPQQKKDVDWTSVRHVCSDYIKRLYNNEKSKDVKQYIFEEVLEALYGPKILNFINSKGEK